MQAIFSSCTPEAILETETITVTDTVFVSTIDTVLVSTTDTLLVTVIDTLVVPNEESVTNFIFVRHAEISGAATNPGLTQEGMDRADRLASMLSELMLDRVYSTSYNRTTQTATPVAIDQGLAISSYGGFDHDDVIDDVLEDLNEGVVLVVGHGNTTANFLNALTGTSDYADLAEDAFDNLYLVSTKSKGDSKVVHLKY